MIASAGIFRPGYSIRGARRATRGWRTGPHRNLLLNEPGCAQDEDQELINGAQPRVEATAWELIETPDQIGRQGNFFW